MIGALRDKYRLNELLAALKISKSSYCYQAKRIREPDKYSKLRTDLNNLFAAVGGCYGYRRLHALLKKSGVTVSEKAIRRLMGEEGLIVRSIKRKNTAPILEKLAQKSQISSIVISMQSNRMKNGSQISQSLVYPQEKCIFRQLLIVLTA